MLEELSVRHLALLEDIHVDLTQGLNVITGETGAGKSLFVTSLSLLMGAKNEQGLIRTGEETAEVSCVLKLPDFPYPEFSKWMEDNAFEAEDGRLILRRILKDGKRGQIFIGGSPASRQQLEEITSFFIDLHGQNEHQSINRSDIQRLVLDQFGGLSDYVAGFQKDYQALTTLNQEIAERQRLMERRDEEAFRLNKIIDEISRAGLQIGEEEEARSEKARLERHESFASALENLKSLLWDGRSSAVGLLRQSLLQAGSLTSIDPSLKTFEDRLESALIELDDIADSFRGLLTSLNFDPKRLEELEERLSLVYSMEKKYGADIPQVLSLLEKSKRDLEMATSAQDSLDGLREKASGMEKALLRKANEISQRRQAAARRMESQISASLVELSMPKVRFEVRVLPRLSETGSALVSPSGMDRVDYYLAANPGEPMKPLKDTASGGELSRVMLAIKAAMNDTDTMSVLVFDEIDTGIGGDVGLALGRYLQKLGGKKQVLCVTHLASIAAHAKTQWNISKNSLEGRTHTTIKRVSGEDRVREIARLLSGNSGSQAGLDHAHEMMGLYSPSEE